MNITTLSEKIRVHHPIELQETPTSAAVLVLLMYAESGELSLLVTKRSQHVVKYAGDYCFPGGIKDANDSNFSETVKREVEEELGMCEQSYKLIGQLDDFYDRYHHLVRPYVAIIQKENFEATLSREIEKIYFFPLDDLGKLQIDNTLERITKRHPAYKYVQDDVVIWGLTASILVHLDNILFGKNREIGKCPG